MKLLENLRGLIPLMLIVLLMVAQTAKVNDKWCWTKSMTNEPSFVYNPDQGGMNWGYCLIDEKEKEKMTDYSINLYTSNVRSSGTSSVIQLQIFGTLGLTQLREISNGNIESGTLKNIALKAKDVGDVNKLLLRISGTRGYRCRNITVLKGEKSTSFDCLRKLNHCAPGGDPFECQMELYPDGDTKYEVSIKTSDEENSGTNSPILISLIGSSGYSMPKIFSETGMKKGDLVKKSLMFNDIGETTGCELKITDPGTWKVSYVIIKNEITNDNKVFNMKNVEMKNPGKNFIKYDSNARVDLSETGEGLIGSSGGDALRRGGFVHLFESAKNGLGDPDKLATEIDDAETDQSLNTPNAPVTVQSTTGSTGNFGWADEGVSSLNGDKFNVNNPWGGVLSSHDLSNVIELDCTQPLINPTPEQNIFGPEFLNGKGNYMSVLAKCPSNCHKVQGKVESVGIHPETSPICLSALVDNAISEYGGIIAISIFPGLDNYTLPPSLSKKGLIDISAKYGRAEKSYTVSKVDNPDLVEKDIRILDNKGQVSSAGRLEMRVAGIWGTICAKGNNPLSAKRVCQDLGYKNGKWESPENESEASDFCRQYKGYDYCGSENYKAHFTGFQCTEGDTSINTCRKSLASALECGRGFDSIIACTNANIQSGEIIPNYVIRLEQVNKQGNIHFGRLEVFARGKWLPVCEHGFNHNSATVACKQMGYDGGEKYFQISSENYKRNIDDTTPFGATGVSCRGKEKALSSCQFKVENILCKHDQDVLLRCSGAKGDPSGKSQYRGHNETPAPGLGKLGMLKYRPLCTTPGNHPIFRGDPGSVYLVHCPQDCLKFAAPVTGTGLFTPDSSICRAAVHAGVIQNSIGGLVAITKQLGISSYMGSTKNGITSLSSEGGWVSAFSVSSVNSGWKGMWKIFKIQMGGSYLEQKSSVLLKNESYLEKKTEMQLPSYSSSYLETAAIVVPTPIFEWMELDPSHLFSDKPEGAVILKNNSMRALPRYTFLMSFTMTDYIGGKSMLFSYSGCGGYNVFLTEDGLVLGDPCDEKRLVNTNLMIGKNDKTIIYAFYNKDKLKVALFSESSKVPVIRVYNAPLEIKNSGTVGIGRLAIANQYFFYGKIDLVQIYDQEIPFGMLQTIFDMIDKKPKKNVAQDKLLTIDGRQCLSPAIDGPIPGQKGAPIPPKEAELDFINDVPEIASYHRTNVDYNNPHKQSSSISATAQGMSSTKESSTPAILPKEAKTVVNQAEFKPEYGTYDKGTINETESIELDCTTTLQDSRFKGSPGKVFRVKCPSCKGIHTMVFGTAIYNPYSSICKAANHSGVLPSDKSGYINLELLIGFSMYNGSQSKNGEKSASMGKSDISFKVNPGHSPVKITCETTAHNKPFNSGTTGQNFVVICPQHCSRANGIVFGSEVYTDNSPICMAALHWGAITDYGGEVEFMILGAQTTFKGTKGFGIISRQIPSYNRSFKFIGIQSAGYYQFKEDFYGKIQDRWEIKSNDKATNPNSNLWEFTEKISNFGNTPDETHKIRAIHHEGKIMTTDPGQFASYVILNGVEWANGRIKTDFMFIDRKECAMLFKYVDNDNYYAIIFSLNKTKNISLVKKISGSYQLIKTKFANFLLGKWYTFTIILNFSHVTIYMKSYNARNNKVLFDLELDELTRGTIGYATNGNANFFIGGIQVDKGKESKHSLPNNRRTWFNILSNSTPRDKKRYCEMYTDKIAFNRCQLPEYFCRSRCTEIISPIENILNYNCIQDCQKKLRSETTNLGKKIDSVYVPKVNDPVDYRRKGDSLFLPAKIQTVKKKKSGKGEYEIQLEYSTPDGSPQNAHVDFPSDRIAKCGEKLTRRIDCIDRK